MQQVLQSSFLQALGLAIANSLWQTALIWLLYTAISQLFKFSSANKYRIAVAAQLIGFIWFVTTLQFYYTQYKQAFQEIGSTTGIANRLFLAESGINALLIKGMVRLEQFLPFISAAYLLLMVFLCVRWIAGYHQTQAIRKQGLQKLPAHVRLFVKRIAAEFGINKQIRLYLSEAVKTPLTIGFLKPIILIPFASINHLSTQQLEAVLLHELAHIKRYDYLVNILLSVIEIALFFNPFTRLISKSIHAERENSCDDWVLQYQYSATLYAEALLQIAYLQTAPAFAMAATGKKNDLLDRVKRMIGKKENRFSYRRQLLALVIVTGMLSTIAWIQPVNKKQYTLKQNTATTQKSTLTKSKDYRVEPMAVRVDNPLFNPVFFLSKPLKEEMKRNIAIAQKEIEELALTQANEPTDFEEAIPPMVAASLELSALALSEANQDQEKNKAFIEVEKHRIEQKFKLDSARFMKKSLSLINQEVTAALQNAKTDIQKAKLEMEKVFQEKTLIRIDEKKLEADIKKAMESVNLKDLEKLVYTSLKIPAVIWEERVAHPEKISKTIEENSNKQHSLIQKQEATKTPANTEESAPYRENSIMEVPYKGPEISPTEMRRMGLDAEQIKWLQWQILKEAAKKKVKLIPVITKDKRTDTEERIIIQFQ